MVTVCVCVYMCMCIYAYAYAYMYVYVCHMGWRTLLKCNKTNHACLPACLCMCLCMCMCMCMWYVYVVCVCMYVYVLYICVCICIHLHTYILKPQAYPRFCSGSAQICLCAAQAELLRGKFGEYTQNWCLVCYAKLGPFCQYYGRYAHAKLQMY
jgi:hypothetical protein